MPIPSKTLDKALSAYRQFQTKDALEAFKVGKIFFQGRAASTTPFTYGGVPLRFTQGSLKKLAKSVLPKGVPVLKEHIDPRDQDAIGRIFSASQTGDSLDILFWVDETEPVVSKIQSGTYPEMSISTHFTKTICAKCGSKVDLDGLWRSENCGNPDTPHNVFQTGVVIEDVSQLFEVSVVGMGAVRDTQINLSLKKEPEESKKTVDNEEDTEYSLRNLSMFSIDNLNFKTEGHMEPDNTTAITNLAIELGELKGKEKILLSQVQTLQSELAAEKEKVKLALESNDTESLNRKIKDLETEIVSLKSLEDKVASLSAELTQRDEVFNSLKVSLGVSGSLSNSEAVEEIKKLAIKPEMVQELSQEPARNSLADTFNFMKKRK